MVSNFVQDMAIKQVCPLNNDPKTPYELGMVKTLTAFGRDAIREFIARVNSGAERKMELTGKLEGAHYAAMQSEWRALTGEGGFERAAGILKPYVTSDAPPPEVLIRKMRDGEE